MTGQEALAEAMRQMIEGEEYTPLERMIADLTSEQATHRPTGAPYSIATVVWHTWFWIHVWVRAIGGEEDPYEGHDPVSDLPEIAAEAWPATREQLREVLQQARGLAATADPTRRTWRGQTVGQNLLQITVHTAYHIGQIALLRQELGLWPPAGGE